MNCEEISELLPAYVLGALDPEEVEAVEAHLRAGREHDTELVELRATVFALDRYGDELVAEPASATPAPIRGAFPVTAQSRRSTFAGLSPLWRVAAVAAVVLVLFGGGWLAGQWLGSAGDTYALALQGADGAFMEVAGETSDDSVTVTMAGLERLDGNSYQVWAIRDGAWVSIGVCNTNAEGRWIGDFDFSLHSGEEVALTVEPSGGSDRPTGEPLLSSLP